MGSGGQEGADVFADAVLNGDIEPGFGGDEEMGAGVVGLGLGLAVEFHLAGAGDDFHAFGEVGAEVVLAGADEAEGFAFAIGEENCMADDTAIEVDVGLGDCGDAIELGWDGRHSGRSVSHPGAKSSRGVGMKTLEPPDTFYLSAAIGWLELGCPEEALMELGGLSAGSRQHPDALEVGWMVQARLEDWGAALAVARELVAGSPDRANGWLHQSYALRRAPGGGLRPAFDLLSGVVERFPKEPTIPYNLACYACQLGWLDVARGWLARAMEVGKRERILEMALGDRDLELLWPELER